MTLNTSEWINLLLVLATFLLAVVATFSIVDAQRGRAQQERQMKEAARQAKEEQIRSIKAFAHAEMEFNLKLLNGFWSNLQKYDSDIEPGNRYEQLIRKLAYLPFPIWSTKLWSNQLVRLVLEQEYLVKALQSYNTLDYLATLQTRAVELVKIGGGGTDYPEYVKSEDYGVLKHRGTPFQEKANQLWEEFYETANKLIGSPNPL